MSPEKEEALKEKYPYLFVNLHYGFEHDDGWYDILDKGCAALAVVSDQIQACQVKEKFGTLSFYLDAWEPPSDAHHYAASAIVNYMEQMSAQRCEICGKFGKQYGGGWIVTRCKEHAPKNDE